MDGLETFVAHTLAGSFTPSGALLLKGVLTKFVRITH